MLDSQTLLRERVQTQTSRQGPPKPGRRSSWAWGGLTSPHIAASLCPRVWHRPRHDFIDSRSGGLQDCKDSVRSSSHQLALQHADCHLAVALIMRTFAATTFRLGESARPSFSFLTVRCCLEIAAKLKLHCVGVPKHPVTKPESSRIIFSGARCLSSHAQSRRLFAPAPAPCGPCAPGGPTRRQKKPQIKAQIRSLRARKERPLGACWVVRQERSPRRQCLSVPLSVGLPDSRPKAKRFSLGLDPHSWPGEALKAPLPSSEFSKLCLVLMLSFSVPQAS